VRGVTLPAVGSINDSVNSAADGTYRLAGLGAGTYTVTPSKTGDINGAISSLDVARMRQYLLNLRTLTAAQLTAADTTNDGVISSLDVARMRQYILGINSTHIIGQWKFAPASKSYSSVTSEQAGQNFEGILVGDVSGDWTASTGSGKGQSSDKEEFESGSADQLDERMRQSDEQWAKQSAAALSVMQPLAESQSSPDTGVTVSLPTNAAADTGTIVEIPVRVTALTEDIDSFDFAVQYDPAVLSPATPSNTVVGTISEGRFAVGSGASPAGRLIVQGNFDQASIPSGAQGRAGDPAVQCNRSDGSDERFDICQSADIAASVHLQ
jgi:hypothetical protein